MEALKNAIKGFDHVLINDSLLTTISSIEYKKKARIREERNEIAGSIRYFKFSGDYKKFDDCKYETK